MEGVALEIHSAQLLIPNATAFGIAFRVEASRDLEAGFRFCVADQVDHRHPVEQRATAPILGNEAEHAMLDLIPLARAGGKMRDLDREMECLGQPLQLRFPEAYTTAVTPAPSGRNIELCGVFV